MPKIYGNTEILGGDLTVLGNMVISGTQTSLNAEELIVSDNIITLNGTFSGAPVLDSGIEINRGSSTNSRLIWNETTDYWVAGLSGSESAIITQSGDGLIKSNNQLEVDFGTVSSIAYVGTQVSNYLPLVGGDLTGPLTIPSNNVLNFDGASANEVGIYHDTATSSLWLYNVETGGDIILTATNGQLKYQTAFSKTYTWDNIAFTMPNKTDLLFEEGTGPIGTLIGYSISANRSWTMPDDTGTIALLSDIPGGVTGSGTTNYIPRWTGVDTLSSTSSIYDDGTKVGIGTNTPDSNSIFSIKGSNTNTTNYGINIKVEGVAQNNNGAYILLSNSTSQSTGILVGWGGTTGKKVGIDVGGGLSVGSSDVGYQYNSTSTTQNSNYGAYLRISSTQSSNTGNYNIITNGLSNGTHQNIYTIMSGGDYSTTYGFRSTNTSTSTIKYGTNINISGNGLSSQNYGTYVNMSGANSTNYGTYVNMSGTYSNTNYGNYTNMSLGKNTTYGSYIRISGDDTGRYVGNYVNITANSGTNSQQNYGSQIQNFGNGSFNTGLQAECNNGSLGNFGVWGRCGTGGGFTVGDIAVYGYIANDNTLTTYSSVAGLFSNNSRSTSTNYGLQVYASGTYSNNIGLLLSVNGGLTNTALQTISGDTVFNESGGDWDFRIEGLTQSNLFFVDADQDRVGIATNTPGADFEVNGFTKLGSDAPAIKTKMIEITTPASGNSGAASSHFITGTIISYDIVIEAVDNKFIKPFETVTPASNYTAHVTTTSVVYSSDYTTNTNIANSQLRCYITYIE